MKVDPNMQPEGTYLFKKKRKHVTGAVMIEFGTVSERMK